MHHPVVGIKRHSCLEDSNLLWLNLSIIKVNTDTKQGKDYIT